MVGSHPGTQQRIYTFCDKVAASVLNEICAIGIVLTENGRNGGGYECQSSKELIGMHLEKKMNGRS